MGTLWDIVTERHMGRKWVRQSVIYFHFYVFFVFCPVLGIFLTINNVLIFEELNYRVTRTEEWVWNIATKCYMGEGCGLKSAHVT